MGSDSSTAPSSANLSAEVERLRRRVADLETRTAQLTLANDELLTDRRLVEQQAARLAQVSTAQRVTVSTLTQNAEQARQRAEQSEQAALGAHQRLRLVVESAPNGVVMIDGQGRIVLVNAQTEKLFGYGRDELLGQPVEILVPERFRDRHPGYRAGFFADPAARAMGVGRDLHGRRKDGSEFPVEIGLNPIRTDEGLFVLSAIVDITERKRAEEKFHQAVESAPNGVVMIDGEGRIVLVNAQTEKLFGYGRDELLGQPVEILVPERFRDRHPGYRSAFFADPAARAMGVGRDLHGRRKDGSEFPVEIGLNPIRTDEGLFVLSAIVDITERKRAEEVQARLAALVESSDDAIVAKTLDGIITTWNAGAERIFGYAVEEVVGRHVSILLSPERADDLPQILERIRRGESVQHIETVRRREDGRDIVVSLTVSPIRDAAGNVIGASKIARDITGRKRAEAKFRLVVESAPNGVVMIDGEGRIVLVNAQTEKLFGYGRDELLGQPVEILVPERFRDRHPGNRSAFFADPAARAMGVGRDLHGRRKDGSEFPVEIGLNPIRTDDWAFVLSAIVDITDRKRAEGELRKHAALLNQAYDAALAWKEHGHVVFWNRGAEDLYGFTAAEALGRVSHELLRTAFPAGLTIADVESQLASTGRWEGELIHTARDGRKIVVDSRLRLTELPETRLILEINRDVTERKEAEARVHTLTEGLEQRVAERTAELEATNKELEAFSYSVSHDLRAPLRAIDGFSRILLEEYRESLPPDGHEYLQLVRDNTRQMGRLVDDLLAFSRLGRQPLRKEQVAPARVVRQCLDELRAEQEGRRVDVRVADLPPCKADPALLKQVWFNLLANALKYTLATGKPTKLDP